MTDSQRVKLAEAFLKERFQKRPHYSFNDWRVMYEHSIDVKNFAVKIAKDAKCDAVVSALAALLHDIGKTYKASKAYLDIHAHDLNIVVAKPLIDQLQLTARQKRKLENAISYKGKAKEMQVMMDADAIAFFKDKRLHSLFFEWAVKKKKTDSLRRHLNKYNNLHFGYSKKIGKQWYEKMWKEWQPYLQKHIT